MKRKSDEQIDLRTALTVTRDALIVIAGFILGWSAVIWIALDGQKNQW